MKTIVVFAALVAVAASATTFGRHHAAPAAAPAFNYQQPAAESHNYVTIVKETPSNNIGVDGYHYSYELSNGQYHDESSQIEARGQEEAVNRVRGTYSYVDPADNKRYTITYVADENGFRAEGEHLPKAPVV